MAAPRSTNGSTVVSHSVKRAFRYDNFMLSTLLAPINDDLVRGRSILLNTWETLEIPREVSVRSTVIYEDEVRRTAKGWRFSARTCDTQPPLYDVYFS